MPDIVYETIFTEETVKLKGEDSDTADKLVDDSLDVQEEYDAAEPARRKQIATERHTTERTLEQGAFCVGDGTSWKTTVKRGLVFSLHLVVTLWLTNSLSHADICNTVIFPEALPYDHCYVRKNSRFEIYLQAFRVTDGNRFLAEAEAVYNSLPRKKVRKGATQSPRRGGGHNTPRTKRNGTQRTAPRVPRPSVPSFLKSKPLRTSRSTQGLCFFWGENAGTRS
jgi:hypothetical protein